MRHVDFADNKNGRDGPHTASEPSTSAPCRHGLHAACVPGAEIDVFQVITSRSVGLPIAVRGAPHPCRSLQACAPACSTAGDKRPHAATHIHTQLRAEQRVNNPEVPIPHVHCAFARARWWGLLVQRSEVRFSLNQLEACFDCWYQFIERTSEKRGVPVPAPPPPPKHAALVAHSPRARGAIRVVCACCCSRLHTNTAALALLN